MVKSFSGPALRGKTTFQTEQKSGEKTHESQRLNTGETTTRRTFEPETSKKKLGLYTKTSSKPEPGLRLIGSGFIEA